jgi:thioredoxin 1
MLALQRRLVARAAPVAFSSALTAAQRTKVHPFDGAPEQLAELLKGKPAVVDFYTSWCGPCAQLAPKLEAMSEDFPDVNFYKVDVEENEDVGAAYHVRSVPKIVVFDAKGEQTGTVEGAMAENIRKLVTEVQAKK